MRFNKSDVAHIASFKEGTFKDWQDIVAEVKAQRRENNSSALKQATRSLSLSFD